MRTQPSWGRHLIGMDGLRGIAAVTVLMGHTNVVLAAGVEHPRVVEAFLGIVSQGLTLFFALSGFLLFRPFVAAMLGGKPRPPIGRFFVNRALRIFPVYIVILLIVSLLAGAAYNQVLPPDQVLDRSAEPVGYMFDPWLLIANALMVHSFFPWSVRTGLGVSWTLSVELVFYLVLPFLALLAARFRPSKVWAFLPPAILLVVGIAGKLWFLAIFHPTDAVEANYLQWGGNWTAVLARSFLTHADLFAFGMVAAVLVVMFQAAGSHRARQTLRWGGLVVGLGAMLLLRDTPFTDTSFAVLAGGAVLFIALRPTDAPGFASRVLEWFPFRYIGLVSYSLYLWHLPVIWFLFQHDIRFPASPLGYWLNLALVLAIGLVLSTITYELIEKPVLRLKRRTDSSSGAAVQPSPIPEPERQLPGRSDS